MERLVKTRAIRMKIGHDDDVGDGVAADEVADGVADVTVRIKRLSKQAIQWTLRRSSLMTIRSTMMQNFTQPQATANRLKERDVSIMPTSRRGPRPSASSWTPTCRDVVRVVTRTAGGGDVGRAVAVDDDHATNQTTAESLGKD